MRVTLLAASIPLWWIGMANAETGSFELRDTCPPSFEESATGTCELRTMYDLYDSVQGAGLGGTQTSLPDHRDGFTPQQIDLGRYLFFDPVLSGDATVSCASCHDPDQGFSDGLPRSRGIGSREVSRAAPTLWNTAFLNKFFWDAHATTLEEQVVGPLFAPNEMGNSPDKLLATLNDIPAYQALFHQAYPQRRDESIQLEEVYDALAAFQTTLISLNSRYDRYAHGYHAALTPPEVIGAPEPQGRPIDVGAQLTYNAPELKAGFKVPTLRNIAQTAPYMHSGRFDNLREVAEFYNGGRGHAVPEGEELQLHWHISSPDLTDYELDRLVDFLGALTDESLKPEVPEELPSGLAPVHGDTQTSIVTTQKSSGDAT